MNPAPGSFWIVLYECRPAIIEISPKGDGFFAFGQDAMWHLSNVQEWYQEVPVERVFKTIVEGEKKAQKNFISAEQCAEQFRNYARSNPNADSKHSLNFCADFLEEFCVPTCPLTKSYERRFYIEPPPAPEPEKIKSPQELVSAFEEEFERKFNKKTTVRYSHGWYRIPELGERKDFCVHRDEIETWIAWMRVS